MVGERVGSYEIVRLLARGGMAVVYLVRQPALERDVVLKRLVLDSDDASLAQRFVHEARLAAALDHPNIVTLFDFFEHDGVPYIAMEYVGGGSLRSLVGRAELPQVFGVLEGVLAGLGHAERHGIAHRDLKPENVLITRRGGVKIADFGIARAYNALTSHRLTGTGVTIGTPTYMAPEQAVSGPLGPYTDLYALGVIAYELLAGRPPFVAGNAMGVLYAHVHTPPPPLETLAPAVPTAVSEWVHRLLAKDPARRPQSAAEAWEALEEIAVAELGPYWRRTAAITAPAAPPAPAAANGDAASAPAAADGAPPTTAEADEEPTVPLGTATSVAVTPPPPVDRGRRRTVRVALAATALLGAAASALIASDGEKGRPAQPRRAPAPPRPAGPYDFDGDGRQELVIAMLRASPRGGSNKSGVVLVHRPNRRPAWTLVTEATADLPGRGRSGDDFGSGLASADFDGDGRADLAIGAPGRERVSILYGSASGLRRGRRQQLAAADMRLPAGAGAYGYALLARDLDDDGYSELVVAAPGGQPPRPDTGAIQILFGGRRGLDASRSRILRRPPGAAGFGTRVRSGDIDGDRHADLVEGAPTWLDKPGHATFCRGGPRGPVRCRDFAGARGTTALTVGDVNGDSRDDVIQGDNFAWGRSVPPPGGGEIRIWRGTRRGPSSSPIVLDQDSPHVPGVDEPGDEFGSTVDAGDLDADGYADMVVGAPGEDARAGRITVIRGGRDGHARTANTKFGQESPGVPGRPEPGAGFGSAATVLRLSRDKRLDLVIALRGGRTANERVMVVEGGPGVFTPDETRTYTLPGVAALVDAPRGGRIRIARAAGP